MTESIIPKPKDETPLYLIGVDPSYYWHPGPDENGIVLAAYHGGKLTILGDFTSREVGEEYSKQVVRLARAYGATIITERLTPAQNWSEHLRRLDPGVSIVSVKAPRRRERYLNLLLLAERKMLVAEGSYAVRQELENVVRALDAVRFHGLTRLDAISLIVEYLQNNHPPRIRTI